jgi:Sulfotransferase family
MTSMQVANPDQKVLDKEFLFIIGSPRSGTTWLQLMLGAHPKVCATTELRLYNKYTAPWLQAWKEETPLTEEGKHYLGLPVLWTEAEFHEFLRGFLDRVYTKVIASKAAATHILDKHPQYSQFVEDIHFLIPGARFIHIIRDGRDVAVSLAAASRQMGWFASEPLPDYGAFWKRELLAARKASGYTGRYLEVRYEDLSAGPATVLKSVLGFCGLAASDELVTAIVEKHKFENLKRSRLSPAEGVRVPEGHYRQGKVGSWYREFTALQRYLFDRTAGDLLRELGYAQRGWWAEGPHQTALLPLAAGVCRMGQRAAEAFAVLRGRRKTIRLHEVVAVT